MEQPEDPPGVGHQIQDFKFDFTTAYIIEIRKRAENRWAMYAEHNKQNPDSIPALTPQEVKIMQNTSIINNHFYSTHLLKCSSITEQILQILIFTKL